MIGLVVTGHGHFADGIHTSAQMIAGENDYVRYINFEEGMTPSSWPRSSTPLLTSSRAATVSWCCPTCPAALPSRLLWSACMHARSRRSRSSQAPTPPMIVTAVTMLDMEDDPRSLADELIDTGRDCIALFELEAATAETESEESDGI